MKHTEAQTLAMWFDQLEGGSSVAMDVIDSWYSCSEAFDALD